MKNQKMKRWFQKMKRWFTLVEVIIAILILSIGLVGILWAFKETFTVLSYINDSINGAYLAKNGVEEIIAVRNNCLSQYSQNGWEKFISQYGSGTFVIKPGTSSCDQSMSGIIDRPSSYEWPLNAFGDITNSQAGVYYYRKVDINTDSKAFYLKQINRTRTATGENLSLVFSQPIYTSPNLLLSVPLSESGGSLVNINSNYGSQYDIDGDSVSPWLGFSNLSDPDTRYSKVFDYSLVTSMTDEDAFSVQDPTGRVYLFEFDDNNSTSNTGATIVSFSGLSLDESQYKLCKELNNLTFVDCRFNKIIHTNFYEKLFGIITNPPMTFGSGFAFVVSGNTIHITLGTEDDLNNKDTNQFINPFYEIRTLPGSDIFALGSDISDTTSGRGVEIPNLADTENTTITSSGYTSLVFGKMSIYMYDTGRFIEETAFSFKLGDIKRSTYY